jgi:hypothetical protein
MFKDEWTGTNKELQELIDFSIENIQMDEDIRLSQKDIKKLFCEAFSRNLVQSELRSMMISIYEESI